MNKKTRDLGIGLIYGAIMAIPAIFTAIVMTTKPSENDNKDKDSDNA